MFRIGIISDTHGLLRPAAERRLTGVDHIVHAGDIGHPEIVDALRRIAPVTAIRGNVDSGEWAREYPHTKLVRLAEKSIYVLHEAAGHRIMVDCGEGTPKLPDLLRARVEQQTTQRPNFSLRRFQPASAAAT